MNILFADKFPQTHLEYIESMGHACSLQPDLTAEQLPGEIAGYDTVVVRSTQVTAAAFSGADTLKLVIRAGAGTNTIDTEAASAKGIHVCNVPGKNAVAVSELVFGLLLAIDRRIPDNVIDLRRGLWNKKRYSEASGLFGRAIGIVGLGAIGLAVAERARAFGLRVHVIRRPGRSEECERRLTELAVNQVGDLGELADVCDILSFHVPASNETRGMLGTEVLSRLKPGAIVINTARGDIVDEDALIAAMDEKGVRAGLDVYAGEPGVAAGEFQSKLAKHPNVYGTHHIGASTAQAQDAVADGVVEILQSFAGGKLINCVNRDPVGK